MCMLSKLKLCDVCYGLEFRKEFVPFHVEGQMFYKGRRLHGTKAERCDEIVCFYDYGDTRGKNNHVPTINEFCPNVMGSH